MFQRKKYGNELKKPESSRNVCFQKPVAKQAIWRTEAEGSDCWNCSNEAKCIVLDEPTAMLDPLGRKDVLNVLHELNRQENVTVILITHYMEEVIDIDKLYVMDDGKLVMSGTPREIFSQVEKLKKLRLDVPHVTELAYELQKEGVPLKNGILTSEEFTEELIRVRNEGFNVNNSR